MDGGADICLSQQLSKMCVENSWFDETPTVGVDTELGFQELGDPSGDTLCSQDFFCTPDFITPVDNQFTVDLDGNKENVNLQDMSPAVIRAPIRIKRPRADGFLTSGTPAWRHKGQDVSCSQRSSQLSAGADRSRSLETINEMDFVPNDEDCLGQETQQPRYQSGHEPPTPSGRLIGTKRQVQQGHSVEERQPSCQAQKLIRVDETKVEAHNPVFPRDKLNGPGIYRPLTCTQRIQGMRGQQRIQSPPCVHNPFLSGSEGADVSTITAKPPQKAGSEGSASLVSHNKVSHFFSDFHEIETLGKGNFSRVYKVRNRLDGGLYAVKRTHKQLLEDSHRLAQAFGGVP